MEKNVEGLRRLLKDTLDSDLLTDDILQIILEESSKGTDQIHERVWERITKLGIGEEKDPRLWFLVGFAIGAVILL